MVIKTLLTGTDYSSGKPMVIELKKVKNIW